VESVTKYDADPMIPVRMKVKKISPETEDVFTVNLVPVEKGIKFSFKPGQFNMLYAFGTGESAISICSDSSIRSSVTHTIHKIGTVTKALAQLKKGEVIGVRGPFGNGWPVKKAKGKDVYIIAGGIGLAPLRPSVYYILKHRKNYGKVFILYGARTPKDLLFASELEQWAKEKDVTVEITVDRADVTWKGHVGVVTTLIDRVSFNPAKSMAMVCGPEMMMSFSINELLMKGLNESSIYLSMERNMKCAIGFCGHCQFGPNFICKDGPVFNYSKVRNIFNIGEL